MWYCCVLLLNLVLISSVENRIDSDFQFLQNQHRYNDPKIVGGTATTIEKHPYLVQLRISGQCSGFILSPTWIMTAAHCVYNYTGGIQLRFGSTIFGQGSFYMSTEFIVHELYNNNTVDYDFALIKLGSPIVFRNTVNSINLPAQDANLPLFGPLTVAGWGLVNTGGEKPKMLKSVDLWVIPRSICNYLYKGFVTDRMFCGGVLPLGGKGSCDVGDSGGPVVYKNVAVGIISASGSPCGAPLKPSIFSKISAVTNWVKSKTGIP